MSFKNLFETTEAPETSAQEFESTSAMVNDTQGCCPKCKGNMSRALIASNEPVFYCTACRVSSPIKSS